MILRTGIDIIEIERIQSVIDRYGERFLKRIFTQEEIDYSGRKTESLAARFSAKEAASKALGTGIGPVSWLEIEILGHELEAPMIALHGRAKAIAEFIGLDLWSVSLSHSQHYATAVVVAIGTE